MKMGGGLLVIEVEAKDKHDCYITSSKVITAEKIVSNSTNVDISHAEKNYK